VESVVAFAVLALAMAGLLSTMGLSTRARSEARARHAALDLAQGVVERAEAGPLARVGLAAADGTVAADPAVSGSAVGATGEPLVFAASPFWSPHTWSVAAGATTVTLSVLVSTPPGPVCTTCVRVTVTATWPSAAGTSGRLALTALVGPTSVSTVLP
jgi:hypothetical protein